MTRGMLTPLRIAGRVGCFALLTATAGLAPLGCQSYDGGLPWSADQFVYNSTPWRPYTISLVDTRTGETLWLVDVPAGHTLKCQFRKGSGPNSYKPDMMSWSVFPTDLSGSTPRNSLPVPDKSTRRVDVVLRPSPEFPDSQPGRSPFTAPSQVFTQADQPASTGQTVEASTGGEAEKTRPVPFVPIEQPSNIRVKDDRTAQPEPESPSEPPVDMPE